MWRASSCTASRVGSMPLLLSSPLVFTCTITPSRSSAGRPAFSHPAFSRVASLALSTVSTTQRFGIDVTALVLLL